MLQTDLVIFKSESLAQHDNAGGYRTALPVQSGKLNDVFTAISDIDFARSAFELVKLYPSVNTNTSEVLHDGHVFLSELPSDNLVKTLLVESPLLSDDDKLPRMRELVTHAQTRFHGLSTLSAAANLADKRIQVATTKAQLLPRVVNVETVLNQLGYVHNPAHNSKKITVTPSTQTSRINVDIADFIAVHGWQIRYSVRYSEYDSRLQIITPDNLQNAVVTYENGQLALELPHAVTSLVIEYYSTNDYRHHQYIYTPTLTLAAGESILPGSMRVKTADSGLLLADLGNGLLAYANTFIAQVDYSTGAFTPESAISTQGDLNDQLGCLVRKADAVGETGPISFFIGSTQFTADTLHLVITRSDDTSFAVDAQSDGTITHAEVTGTVSEAGYVVLTPQNGMQIKRVAFDVELTTETIIDAPWLGLNTSELPADGLVNMFNKDGQIMVLNRERTELASLTPNATINSLAGADYVDISDSQGVSLFTAANTYYSYDKTTGVLTLGADFTPFTAPFVLTVLQGELATVTSVSTNELVLLTGLKRSYNQGAVVAGVQVLGNLGALAINVRTQSAWNNDFGQNGASGSSSLNFTQYPIELSNKGAINQRWAVVFNSSTQFTVYGESVGVVGSGDTLNDFAPTNSLVSEPFFVIKQAAIAQGLQPGECILFETQAAAKPIMLSRAISPGHSNIEFDSSTLGFRGSV